MKINTMPSNMTLGDENMTSELAKVGAKFGGIIVVVLAALMLADGVAGSIMEGTSFIFEGINPLFKITVAIISIVLGEQKFRA